MNEQQKAYLIALNEFPKFGPRRMKRLFNVFDTPQAIFKASTSELQKAGIKPGIVAAFIEFRKTINLRTLTDIVKANNLTVVCIFDNHYPALLKEIYDPPILLFIKGNLPNNTNEKQLSIVGSRKASPYGEHVANMLTKEIVKSGISTVSGLAYGIDQTVHNTTISANGSTTAVLGFGILHKPTQREKRMQAHIIKNNGCLISEFPLFMHGARQNFPIRNRIIAGLSQATLIIEAAEKSGSLVTARLAMEQNREVLAVPGPITSSNSTGTNQLIQQGAHPITSAQDILHLLSVDQKNINKNPKPIPTGDSEEENQIIALLSTSPQHINTLIRTLNLSSHCVASTISLLELKGYIEHLGGEEYSLC